jgi:hypothetical protein
MNQSFINEGSIPSELKSLRQFVVWKLETRAGSDKPTKVPYDAKTGRKASSTNPQTWSTFDIALRAIRKGAYSGIGFMFANGYCGVDFDKCRSKETGEIEIWALEMIEKLDSYTEVSPSGTGLHVIARAKLDGEGARKGPIELYDTGRYFTLTGLHLEGASTTINERQEIINGLYEAIREVQAGKSNRQPVQKAPAVTLTLDDECILDLTRKASNGAKFERLWGGGTADYDDDRSRADLALVSILCFYAQDDFQVERLWKQSGLYRAKLERADYVQRTIRSARAQQTETYGAKQAPARNHPASDDISELEEITDDDPAISDDPKRERYLRQCARNTAKVLDAIRLIFLYLGFKKNHNRLLSALIRKGKDRLKPFPAKHDWLLQQYVKNDEKVSSAKTIQRDIQELQKEEKKLGVKMVGYTPGNEYRGVSLFQSFFMRYALEAVNEAINRSGEFDYPWEALEAACKDVAAHIPRNPLTTSDEAKKREREDSLKQAKRKAIAGNTKYLRLLLEEGQEREVIVKEANHISRQALNQILKEFERLLSGQSCPLSKTEFEEVYIQ